MQSANLLFILSDDHSKRVLGCYGGPFIKTPNLDRLAVRGTRFADAYTHCPICGAMASTRRSCRCILSMAWAICWD